MDYTVNILRIAWWHSKGYWGRNMRTISTSVISYVTLLTILSFFLGYYNFYHSFLDKVNSAQVITIDSARNLILSDSSSANWNGGTLVITNSAKWIIDGAYRAFSLFAIVMTVAMMYREISLSNHLTKLELESREGDYRILYRITLSTKLVWKLVLVQKLLFSGISLLAGILITQLLVLPFVNARLDPRIAVFFTYHLDSNSYLAYIPLMIMTLLGIVFSIMGTRKMVRRNLVNW